MINVPAHNTQFVYGGGSYEVVTEGVGLGDTIFGAVRPTGVAVLHLRQWRVPSVVDVEGAPVMDYDTSSGGPAEMYANGTVIRGSWSAAGQEGVFELHDSNNQPVGMPPGLLWVSLAP